jgi:hypothetical protein
VATDGDILLLSSVLLKQDVEKRQNIETLINEEALLFAKYILGEQGICCLEHNSYVTSLKSILQTDYRLSYNKPLINKKIYRNNRMNADDSKRFII